MRNRESRTDPDFHAAAPRKSEPQNPNVHHVPPTTIARSLAACLVCTSAVVVPPTGARRHHHRPPAGSPGRRWFAYLCTAGVSRHSRLFSFLFPVFFSSLALRRLCSARHSETLPWTVACPGDSSRRSRLDKQDSPGSVHFRVQTLLLSTSTLKSINRRHLRGGHSPCIISFVLSHSTWSKSLERRPTFDRVPTTRTHRFIPSITTHADGTVTRTGGLHAPPHRRAQKEQQR